MSFVFFFGRGTKLQKSGLHLLFGVAVGSLWVRCGFAGGSLGVRWGFAGGSLRATFDHTQFFLTEISTVAGFVFKSSETTQLEGPQ